MLSNCGINAYAVVMHLQVQIMAVSELYIK